MKHPNESTEVLAPLLDSIGREVAERRTQLERLDRRITELRASPFFSGELALLEAAAACERRELRQCRQELERLGCSVVGTAPLTVRIPTRAGSSRKSRMWRHQRESNN